jgi:hypothetical protein
VRVVPRREPAVRPVVLQQLVEVVEEVRDRGVHVAERAVQRGDALGLDGGFRGERGGGVGGEAYCAEKEREEERAEGRERGGSGPGEGTGCHGGCCLLADKSCPLLLSFWVVCLSAFCLRAFVPSCAFVPLKIKDPHESLQLSTTDIFCRKNGKYITIKYYVRKILTTINQG